MPLVLICFLSFVVPNYVFLNLYPIRVQELGHNEVVCEINSIYLSIYEVALVGDISKAYNSI